MIILPLWPRIPENPGAFCLTTVPYDHGFQPQMVQRMIYTDSSSRPAGCAAMLGTHEPLRGQLRIALNNGVTKEEIVELFIHLEAYAGAARAFDSYQIALEIFAETTGTG